MSGKGSNHGGKRPGSGRPRGSPNKRSIEAIEAVAERYPEWTPLLHFAAVANDETQPADIRLDAAKAAAPYMHPRPKPVEQNAEALIELETRLAEIRSKAITKEAMNPYYGLGDRIERAFKRLQEKSD